MRTSLPPNFLWIFREIQVYSSFRHEFLFANETSSETLPAGDPFALDEQVSELPQLKDEPPLDLSFFSHSNDSVDPSNLSIGHSEVSMDIPVESKDNEVHINTITDLVAPSEEDTSYSSCESRGMNIYPKYLLF